MDKGPFRGHGQDSKSYQPQQPAQEPELEKVPVIAPRTTYSRKSNTPPVSQPSGKRWLVGVLLVIGVLLLGLIAWMIWQATKPTASGIDTSKYQMVKLSDGQSYYGKLSVLDDEHMKLTDVFYLENEASTTGNTDDSTSTDDQSSQNKYKLLKFTGIYFGPEDEMTISRNQIINYANLDADSKIVKIIEQYNTSNN